MIATKAFPHMLTIHSLHIRFFTSPGTNFQDGHTPDIRPWIARAICRGIRGSKTLQSHSTQSYSPCEMYKISNSYEHYWGVDTTCPWYGGKDHCRALSAEWTVSICFHLVVGAAVEAHIHPESAAYIPLYRPVHQLVGGSVARRLQGARLVPYRHHPRQSA